MSVFAIAPGYMVNIMLNSLVRRETPFSQSNGKTLPRISVSTDESRLTYYSLRSHHVTGCVDGVSAPANILNVSVLGGGSVGSATELP